MAVIILQFCLRTDFLDSHVPVERHSRPLRRVGLLRVRSVHVQHVCGVQLGICEQNELYVVIYICCVYVIKLLNSLNRRRERWCVFGRKHATNKNHIANINMKHRYCYSNNDNNNNNNTSCKKKKKTITAYETELFKIKRSR